ncbi:MAG: FMN-binding protein [Candidatus Izemoplasmatales bacterium]|nr:FMN-binding protein [Candidatus Izemoplasmatales bacterium]
MNKGLVSGLVLLALGLLCGVLLAGVNSFTAPIIKDLEDQVKYTALAEFYTLSDYTIEEIAVSNNKILDTIFVLKDITSGEVLAAVYSVKSYGYQSNVKLLIAVEKDLSIKGYKVVEQGETAGLGSQSVTFSFMATGVGTDITDISGFDSISGSTITSNAVYRCFNEVSTYVASYGLGGVN